MKPARTVKLPEVQQSYLGMYSINGSTTTVVWCLTDGKPGHANQLRGLVSALERRRDIDVHWLDVPSRWESFRDWITRRSSLGHALPRPKLILAAGQATHAAALSVRRSRGGRVVLLMRPSLPANWFDLCLIPDHDLGERKGNNDDVHIVRTCGVLNSVQPASTPDVQRGLFLIGGPSKHHDWDDSSIDSQVREIVGASAETQWTLTTSRRTPETFFPRLAGRSYSNITIIPASETPTGWVEEQLTTAGTVFVTEDSVSMVYEALSANADVGLLHVPRRRTSRVIRGVDRLAESRVVIPFAEWMESQFKHRQPCVLQEADRCAGIVCSRLLDAA
ncbi:MAG: mitochondrial fission ELM1 family protein [Planctomycetaceae bacterium]|nr:mitochondrial fission ELM1 family protein [Planctomycetaceae bacterium]